MKRALLLAIFAAAVGRVQITPAQVTVVEANDISGERIRAHVKFLASDLLEGRGVGARGGDLATEYIATQLALAGAKPAGAAGSYFQPVPLVGVETQPATTFHATAGSKSVDFTYVTDYVGSSQFQQPETSIDAPMVFVGHGISAPEFHWDDFKGVDVKDKVIVLFTNEPPSTDPKFFGGRALTYYGRWTYKYEEALRRGLRGRLPHTRASSSTVAHPVALSIAPL